MRDRVYRLVALMISVTVAASGCGGARWNATMVTAPVAAAPAEYQQVPPSVLAEYVRKLPPGTTVRVDRLQGKSVRGILMKATDQSIVVQPRTRIPEPPIEIALNEVLRVTPEAGNGSLGRAVGIGVAAGAGAALAVILILAAIFSD